MVYQSPCQRKQKKDKITTAKRQLKISTPQNSNTSTAKTKDTGNNELPAATAPSPNHNNESPATAERKSPIAASDKAKSSKGNLQQQNEKLRRNLQKAIQAAKDARAQRQKLAQEVKEVKAINSDLQQKLEANTKYFRKAMSEAGFDIKEGIHPIVPVMLYDARLAGNMADKLLDEGIYVIGFSFPVVPKDQARIRVQISAAHSQEDLDKAISAFIKVGKQLNVLE